MRGSIPTHAFIGQSHTMVPVRPATEQEILFVMPSSEQAAFVRIPLGGERAGEGPCAG